MTDLNPTSTATSAATSTAAELRPFARSLPMALLRAREAVMAHFRPILAEHDLSEQQWRVLRALDAAGEPMSVGALASETFLLGPSLSRMLVVLQQRQLIERHTSAEDGRRSDISISPAGVALLGAIAPYSEAAYENIDATFGAGELDQLFELLRRTTHDLGENR